jgi:phosphatidylserine decarboxylase
MVAPVMPRPTPVTFLDRRTGETVTEPVMAEAFLRWMYGHPVGRAVTALMRQPFVSTAMGRWRDRRTSVAAIRRFAAEAAIDLDEARDPIASFATLNAFFARHLKAEARPIDPHPDHLISLGDGKLLVFPAIHQGSFVPVKGASVRIGRLLGDDSLAARYEGGSALILRLAPGDYHRFHFVEAGIPSAARDHGRRYDTVNPIGLATGLPILTENRRAVSTLQTEGFGEIATIEVGAMMVGSIVQTYTPGVPVERGQEKGYFQFGGSTVIQLFEPGRLQFDDDLIAMSKQAIEVRVRMGERIGRRPAGH